MIKQLNVFYILAALFSLLIFVAHTYSGEIAIAKPLLNMDMMSDEVKYGLYYCWHIATLALVFLTTTYIYCAFVPSNIILALNMTLFSACIAALGIGMALVVGASFEEFGQGYLFVPVTLFGAIGLFFSNRKIAGSN